MWFTQIIVLHKMCIATNKGTQFGPVVVALSILLLTAPLFNLKSNLTVMDVACH